MSLPKKELYRLVDALPEQKIAAAKRFLESLLIKNSDDEQKNLRPLSEHLANPEYDDEPETEEERATAGKALDDIKAGRIYDLEDIAKELGICLS